MQYVLLIHAAESRYAAMSREESEAFSREYMAMSKEIFATGRAGDCSALEPTSTATCVSIRDGKRIVKDGPFAETREQLGGYYVFDAKDDEDAFAWAEKIPDARNGTIEIRPVPTIAGASTPSEKPLDPKTHKEFVLLIYEDEKRWASLPEAEAGAIMSRYLAFSRSIKESGNYLGGSALEPTTRARSLRLEQGKRVVRDGPFAETREQLGGYYHVVAKTLDEAIALAARIPAAETGTIEVRPVMDVSAYM